MFTIANYYFATSVSDAYEKLVKAKTNVILGGAMWLRMSDKQINTAIDISKIDLNYIKEDDKFVYIGAMATLADIENSQILRQNFGTIFSDMTYHIVGTQFRNTATVGGSIFGRYGFSDILTGFLPLNAVVKTAKYGEIELVKFNELSIEKDVLEYIKIPKTKAQIVYKTLRNQSTDFPILSVCAIKDGKNTKISVGARPKKAKLIANISEIDTLDFGSNMRGSAEYRRLLAKSFIEDMEV